MIRARSQMPLLSTIATKDAMKDTEKTLKVKCPLDCDFKIGTTWMETH